MVSIRNCLFSLEKKLVSKTRVFMDVFCFQYSFHPVVLLERAGGFSLDDCQGWF